MHQHKKHRRWMLSFVVILIALIVATPALADYIGPKRTVTETTTSCKIVLSECEYSSEKSTWRYKTVEDWSCSLESKPWQQYSGNKRACNDTNHEDGYQYWSKEESERLVTNTYQPATIYSSLQNCTIRNGWCITVPHLLLSGFEPVPGYNIFAIEGTLNGQNFACMNSNCSVPLNQGNNNFTYWALSSFLDSSEMGSISASVDSVPPTINGTLTGTLGQNGWYLSPITFNSSASDVTSGLASFTCTRDGAPLGSCNSIALSTPGTHTIVLTALDNAGHTQTLTQNAFIDTQNPVLNASINGTLGSNNWYTAAALSASASDPTPGSGLSVLQYKLDGNTWIPFPASGTLTLTNGQHTIDLRATDKAGRTVTSSKSYALDPNPPSLKLNLTGTLGLNNWYNTDLTFTASVSDGYSGLDTFEYSIDNSAWTAYTAPVVLSEGSHSIAFWVQDRAGLVTQFQRTFYVDTRSPEIAGGLSGIPGMNDWFISEVTVSASASDPMPGSDLEAFTYILNGDPENPYTVPLTLVDGQHTLQLIARDRSGLSHSVEQSFKIDTVQPSLIVDISFPNWVRDEITFNGSAGDSGSGLAAVEISVDGEQTWQPMIGTEDWNFIWDVKDKPSGIHQVSMRAVDQAGLIAQQLLKVGIDNLSPAITLPNSWLQWDTVTLNVQDEHSGLSQVSIEISDPQGRGPARLIQLDPTTFPLEFKWDRRMGDDTIAEAGTYDVNVIAVDSLGNTAYKTASLHVLLDILPPGPTSTPQPYTPTVPVDTATSIVSSTVTSSTVISSTVTSPTVMITPTSQPVQISQTATPTGAVNSIVPTASPKPTQAVIIRSFGTIAPTAQVTHTPAATLAPRATPTRSNAVDWLQSVFSPETREPSVTQVKSKSEPQDVPASSNVLWGTAAAAAVSAATIYAQEEKRRREEELARQKQLEEAEEESRQKKKERKMKKMEAQRAQEAAWEAARQKELDRSNGVHMDLKVARLEYEEGVAMSRQAGPTSTKPTHSTAIQDRRAERKDEQVQQEINSYTAKPQDWKADYDAYMAQKAMEEKEKEKQESSSQPQEKSWWEKTVDWADDHQVQIALGLGIVAGVAAIVLSGGIAAPAVAAAWMAGAAAAAGGTTALMTIGLNAHYDRPWNENLLRNVLVAEVTAVVVSGAWFVFQAASTGIGAYCGLHQSTCARVEPVFNAIDAAEQAWLSTKLAYQTRSGDVAGAADTAFELHSEYADGGMPGNSVAKELGDQVTHISKNAVPVIQKYGLDVIPLLAKHGDEGLQLIQKFGLDGISLLQKYGNDAADLVHIDRDVLDYVMQQGDDAVAAFCRWSEKDLLANGAALALRAKKDGQVLADIKKLAESGPINPETLTNEQKALINAIAANSTQNGNSKQVVLGKWVDNSSGFVQTAQETSSLHYNPHPDMWNMLEKLGKEKQEEVAWLVNKQVIQNGVDDRLPFKYTLNGIPANNIADEGKAVAAIFAGATDDQIIKILKVDKMPIRMKELKELQKAGYQVTFDDISKSFILTPK